MLCFSIFRRIFSRKLCPILWFLLLERIFLLVTSMFIYSTMEFMECWCFMVSPLFTTACSYCLSPLHQILEGLLYSFSVLCCQWRIDWNRISVSAYHLYTKSSWCGHNPDDKQIPFASGLYLSFLQFFPIHPCLTTISCFIV